MGAGGVILGWVFQECKLELLYFVSLIYSHALRCFIVIFPVLFVLCALCLRLCVL